ncbi:MAG: AraC family transcriptional regulator [Bacteroides sp.]|nr:AraC family transcriptional regulator [Bacteroides sp.]
MTRFFIIDPVLQQMLRNIGARVDEALIACGIEIDSCEPVKVTESQYIRFMEVIRESLPGDDAVLRIINIKNIETFSPPSFAAMCSRNGHEFIERLIRYKQIVCPFVFSCSESNDIMTLSITTFRGEPLPAFMEELEVAFILSLVRSATGQHIYPVKIGMAHRIVSEALISFFGIDVTPSSTTSISMSVKDLGLPFMTYNDNMWNCLRPGLDRQLFEAYNDNAFVKNVRQNICRQLSGGNCLINEIAESMCMSVRTFQRRLAEHSLKFNEMVAEARHELAIIYLANPEMTVADISYMLGFKEYNSFLRAFRKWEGKGVAEYRRMLVHV